MGALFEKLCRGPVVVIDDQVGEGGDLVNKLIAEIKAAKLPVLGYKSLEEAKDQMGGLFYSNFIILDWRFLGGNDPASGVQLGAEVVEANDQEVMNLINVFQKNCMAPIFIISAIAKNEILAKLEAAGIPTQDKACVFVENKGVLCDTPGKLISTIEDWISKSPHVYLTKFWFNEWITKNNSIFWDLYELNPNWPILFYRTFEQEEDPIIALKNTLFQLIYSELDVSAVDPARLTTGLESADKIKENESLKILYQRLVYLKKDIEKDIQPGDIFKKGKDYYMNIRPDCDTTTRGGADIELYLLKGNKRAPSKVKEGYLKDLGVIDDKESEITMPLLDGKPFVVFSKRNLCIEKYSDWKTSKICRVASPFITRIRQNYSSYIGRFGLPSYPKQIIESLFTEPNGPDDYVI